MSQADEDNALELYRAMRAQLEVLQLTACPGLPPPPANARVDDLRTGGAAAALERLRQQLGNCQRCKLAQGRRHLVFGEGSPDAPVVFVGEGPGEEEDRQGRPFVGKAGELLTKMIAAMGLSRDSVYICNVVKCRPPGNRDPEPDEIATCRPFLEAQLSAIQPRAIVALGRCAAQTLLATPAPISRLRGRWGSFLGLPLLPTFHPAYLLRDPTQKRPVWQDLQAVMAMLEERSG